MNAREIEDYFESLNRASLVKLFTLLWRHRQQSLITLQRGPRFPVFQRRMGLMRNVNKLELRNGSGSGPWHQVRKDGKPVDIWGWDEVPARPVQYVAYAIEEDGKYLSSG